MAKSKLSNVKYKSRSHIGPGELLLNMRGGQGLSIAELKEIDRLLQLNPVRELSGSTDGLSPQAALYLLISHYLRENKDDLVEGGRPLNVALAYAFNVDTNPPWNGADLFLLPDSLVGERRQRFLVDYKIARDEKAARRLEEKAHSELVSYLFNLKEAPQHLLEMLDAPTEEPAVTEFDELRESKQPADRSSPGVETTGMEGREPGVESADPPGWVNISARLSEISRQTRLYALLIVIVVAAGLGLVALTDWLRLVDDSPGGPDTTAVAGATNTSGARPADMPSTDMTLALIADGSAIEQKYVDQCTGLCVENGLLRIEHPSWGPSTVQLIQDGRFSFIKVVDEDGEELWEVGLADAVRFGFKFHVDRFTATGDLTGSIDRLGHLFITYTGGKQQTVIILAPTENGFKDFRTIPAYGGYLSRFYDAAVVDVDGDGIYEIREFLNDCLPSCATGGVSSRESWWDGSDYVLREE